MKIYTLCIDWRRVIRVNWMTEMSIWCFTSRLRVIKRFVPLSTNNTKWLKCSDSESIRLWNYLVPLINVGVTECTWPTHWPPNHPRSIGRQLGECFWVIYDKSESIYVADSLCVAWFAGAMWQQQQDITHTWPTRWPPKHCRSDKTIYSLPWFV